jgi:hypothetical protein
MRTHCHAAMDNLGERLLRAFYGCNTLGVLRISTAAVGSNERS